MRLLILVGSLLVLSAGSAAAATFYVTLTTDIPDALPGDGKCSYVAAPPPDQAVCTLRAAVMEANATVELDTILLQDGATYPLTITGRDENAAASGDLDILNPLKIRPVFSGRATIDAKGIDRVFDVIAPNVTLIGLDITGGSVDDGNDQTCDGVGGIETYPPANNLQLTRLRVHHNVGSCAGTVYLDAAGGGAKLAYTEIYSNSALGVDVISTDAEITSCSIHDNGGISLSVQNGALVTLSNSTVSQTGPDDIGMLLRDNSTALVSNSTLVGANTIYGGSIYVGLQSRLFMANSIVVGHCDIENDSLQDLTLYDNLYNGNGCPSAGPNDNSLRNQTVFLSPLGYYGGFTSTYRPLTVSPAIDHTAGPICDNDDVDQRGKPRKVAFKGGEAKCDIGAVELESDVIYFDSLEWF